MSAVIHDSFKELTSSNYRIGVRVERLASGCVAIEDRSPAIWSSAFVNILLPGENWRAKVVENTRHVITRIDAVIEELQRHRARLVGEAKKLEAGQ